MSGGRSRTVADRHAGAVISHAAENAAMRKRAGESLINLIPTLIPQMGKRMLTSCFKRDFRLAPGTNTLTEACSFC